jgi:uncharacterized damage-inducible protein DinB
MLPRLLDHLLWADLRTAASLDTLPELPEALLRTWGHLLAAEAVWLARLAGREAPVEVWPTLDRADGEALMHRNHVELRHWAGVPTAALDRIARYTTTRGERCETPIVEVLHHVVLHGMYHRGQLAQEVRRLGGEPLSTDLIFYLRT